MAHTKELEELEGRVNKFTQECEMCTLREHRDKEDWCFIFAEPPTKKCNRLVYKRSVLENRELSNLFNRFPNLNQDN